VDVRHFTDDGTLESGPLGRRDHPEQELVAPTRESVVYSCRRRRDRSGAAFDLRFESQLLVGRHVLDGFEHPVSVLESSFTPGAGDGGSSSTANDGNKGRDHLGGGMTAIKDSVHDHIEVTGVALDLLDVPEVQRLRHIKQLSTVRLVYPSANHTRFEHSLGVYHLARRALSHLDVDGDRAECVRAAALLHDVGHGPYGHQTEDVIQRHAGVHHDEVHDLLDRGAVARVLTEHGIEPSRVADLVAGDGEFGQLVSGELDVDRMDYLVRDAHHTGVPYGTVDHERLVRSLRLIDGELVLDEGNVQTAEGLLVARALMNAAVYRHHVSRIAGAMLERASERLLDAGVGIDEFRRMADHDLLSALREHESTATLGERLRDRDLYKRAVWAEREAVPGRLLDLDYETCREREREIAADADVDPQTVILDIPDRPSMRESSVRVVVAGEVRRLDEQSPLVEALRAAGRTRWRLGVYSPPADVEAVDEAARRVLGLEGDSPVRETDRRDVDASLDRYDG
jgi:HD superfamily phosphohydrolase